MADESIKIKVTTDGAVESAKQFDKLTASMEKQRKTQEMIAKTSEQIRRKNIIDDIKREAAAVNDLGNALQRQQMAAVGANGMISKFGDNTQQLRAKLGPAAALIGNLGSSLGTLAPQLSGVTTAFQRTGMAAGQMLGVLGGGPGVVIGGLVAGVTMLATYMAQSKQEADELARATKANAEAMGDYLDQIERLRSKAGAKIDQKKQEADLRSRLMGGGASADDFDKEIATQNSRLDNQYYSNTGGLSDFERNRRGAEADQIRAYVQQLARQKNEALEQQYAREAQQRDKFEVEAAIIEAGGLPETKAKAKRQKERGSIAVSDSSAFLMEQAESYGTAESAMDAQRKEVEAAEAAYEKKQDLLKQEYDRKIEFEEYFNEAIVDMSSNTVGKLLKINADYNFERAANEQVFKNAAVSSAQMVGGTAIKMAQMVAKGQKVQAGAILEGIGDQMVSQGTFYILDGIARSIMMNPGGPALIGVGTAMVSGGLALGSAGANSAGGSMSKGGGGGPSGGGNGYGGASGPYATPYGSPQNPTTPQGPTQIVINMPTVLSPTAEDGQRVKEALRQANNVYGA